MIELIYNEEENSTIEEKKLPEPKNVKQVGAPGEYKKIFVEDYVHTYLQQYSVEEVKGNRFGVLLGSSERSGGKRHLYIKSALPVEGISEKQGKYCFSEKVWGEIYRDCEKYFSEQEILGWFFSRPGFALEKNAMVEETHRTYFSGADKLLFLMEPIEADSAFFGFDGNRFARQSGYYIYYEKNEAMREFIMDKNEQQKKIVTSEEPDLVMANFRKILKEKQEKNEKRKKQVISYGVRVAVTLLLFAGAVAVKDRMDVPVVESSIWQSDEVVQDTEVSEVLVEELPGEVEEQPEEIYEPAAEETITELPVADEAIEETAVYEEYVVQAGDTLAKISRDIYGSDDKISEICTLNEISNGDYIQAGEIILLP